MEILEGACDNPLLLSLVYKYAARVTSTLLLQPTEPTVHYAVSHDLLQEPGPHDHHYFGHLDESR